MGGGLQEAFDVGLRLPAPSGVEPRELIGAGPLGRRSELCGGPAEDTPKVARNELAFFRAELAKELHEAVERERETLVRRLRRILEEQEPIE